MTNTTTRIAEEKHTRHRALAAVDELEGRTEGHSALGLSIMRDPASNDLWPARLRRILRAGLTHWGSSDLVDTAQLLLTELTTNAFRHAYAPTVGIRVYRQDTRLRIEVTDGSPQGPLPGPTGPYEEHGRGLILVDAMADSWGVSGDRTKVWCTITLPAGLPEMVPAPVRHEATLRLPGDVTALNMARIKGRTLLALLHWSGDQRAAVDVLYVLVRNALEHAITPGDGGDAFHAWLRITDADELVIDVWDPEPDFPDYEKAIEGVQGRGLRLAQGLGAEIRWLPDAPYGKTVRAILQPGSADL
ncbi:ATP-binding protein [Streptomyces sp. NPDC058052]|uniref:ATP-binding protein n=1 Tax=Streptomyces sp. NPDC058052 TaxID=3346316 RepID=UPI0036E32784